MTATQIAYEDGKEAFAEWAAKGHAPTRAEAMREWDKLEAETRYSGSFMSGWLDAAIAAT